MKHHRKFFIGLIVAVTAIALMAGGVAVGAFLFTRDQGATVRVMGSGAELYSDPAATTLLSPATVLQFGDVRTGTPSPVVHLYLKNTGTDVIYPTLKVSSLNAALKLKETTYGDIGATPIPIWSLQGGPWVPSGITNTLNSALTTVQVPTLNSYVQVTTGVGVPMGSPTVANPWVMKVGTEYIAITAATGGTPTACIRGYNGSTAVAHTAGEAVSWGRCDLLLTPGAIQDIALRIEGNGALTTLLNTSQPFTINLNVTSDY